MDDGIKKCQKYVVECNRYGHKAVCRRDSYHTGDCKSSVKLELNLSSIDDNGEFGVSSCLGCFSKKQLPSLFPLATYG